MQALKKNPTCILYSFLFLLLFAQPVFSETVISENSLPADAIVEEFFQGGSGLPVENPGRAGGSDCFSS